MNDRATIEKAVGQTSRIVAELAQILQRHGFPIVAHHLSAEAASHLTAIDQVAKRMPQ